MNKIWCQTKASGKERRRRARNWRHLNGKSFKVFPFLLLEYKLKIKNVAYKFSITRNILLFLTFYSLNDNSDVHRFDWTRVSRVPTLSPYRADNGTVQIPTKIPPRDPLELSTCIVNDAKVEDLSFFSLFVFSIFLNYILKSCFFSSTVGWAMDDGDGRRRKGKHT